MRNANLSSLTGPSPSLSQLESLSLLALDKVYDKHHVLIEPNPTQIKNKISELENILEGDSSDKLRGGHLTGLFFLWQKVKNEYLTVTSEKNVSVGPLVNYCLSTPKSPLKLCWLDSTSTRFQIEWLCEFWILSLIAQYICLLDKSQHHDYIEEKSTSLGQWCYAHKRLAIQFSTFNREALFTIYCHDDQYLNNMLSAVSCVVGMLFCGVSMSLVNGALGVAAGIQRTLLGVFMSLAGIGLMGGVAARCTAFSQLYFNTHFQRNLPRLKQQLPPEKQFQSNNQKARFDELWQRAWVNATVSPLEVDSIYEEPTGSSYYEEAVITAALINNDADCKPFEEDPYLL